MKLDGIRKYVWIELAIWFVILCLVVFGIRIYKYQQQKDYKTYQIFMQDVDGLIVGSPVKFMGVQVGYIQKIKLVGDDVYIKFVMNEKEIQIPTGSIATVEFNGLGGSKSLEIYPPTNQSLSTGKLIVVNSPKRIHDSLGLLNQMFDKIGSLTSRGSYFVKQISGMSPITPTLNNNRKEIKNALNVIDNWLDKCENCRKKLNKNIKGEE